MNKTPKATESIFVNTLNANDHFLLPGSNEILVCVARATGHSVTHVWYRPLYGAPVPPLVFAKYNREVVYVVD